MGKLLKACGDLDLDPTMLSIEIFGAIFIYYKVFQFHVPRWISQMESSCKHTHAHTHKDGHTHKHKMSTL